ncbi:polyamine aminopropyltransferase [Cytophagaceae bacterium YF14B1]|uniref:Polyamine aminopropyltransferase n=1 Tax=Xanthocytophaga flava TaxID=3048013 RepID=A0AAE3QN67_9BACT|nr:polyamine aminopropyltransferase [Xanthocytophaga flavus]MDJ1480115.1 polyamine aminopropyltransferase [Xanthocytophaga flavus]
MNIENQTEEDKTKNQNKLTAAVLPVLLVSVFIIATCGILYELLISSISTYFLGSSILQFSLTIGFFMSFMGVGSFLSKYIHSKLLDQFVTIEIILGLLGGFSAFILYFSYSLTENYHLIAFTLISLLGTLIGLEIPLVTRIVHSYASLKDTVAKVLSFDYIGALLASIIFPLLLLPYLGTMRTSFLIGILNLAVAAFNSQIFMNDLTRGVWKRNIAIALILVLLTGFIYSFHIVSFFEQFVYQDEILVTRQSPYQRIVVTKWHQDYRLYLNGHLQFSSADEYRYHEPLVHIPMALAYNHEKVLVLGGGDGLAVRELLRYKDIQQIDLVDLDKAMTDLGQQHPIFRQLNKNSLTNKKVRIFNEDAYKFIEKTTDIYSVIIIDLPDPSDPGLGKLYSHEFYQLLQKRLAIDGIVVTQATSPYFATEAFWCITHTLGNVFTNIKPYTVYVPSFGQWGFVLASNKQNKRLSKNSVYTIQQMLKTQPMRFLKPQIVPGLFAFDPDMAERPTPVNTLDTQILVQSYEKSLRNWE